MSFSIYHNTRTDRQYKAAVGLSRVQFEDLYQSFAPFYQPKSSQPYGPDTVLLDKREALFFILHYYKAYPTLLNMGIYFGFSEYTVSTYLERIKPCLKAALQAQGCDSRVLFASQSDFDEAFADVTDLVIDATEVCIERPVDQTLQEEFYSGKKNNTP